RGPALPDCWSSSAICWLSRGSALSSRMFAVLRCVTVAIPMPVPAIEFRSVTFARPGQPRVLDHFSLSVDAGEVLALVGRSGAGKSTLLKLVNRLLLPDEGAVVVEGRDTREWEPIRLRRRIGYVLQEVGLFPHMTVEGNIAIVPRLERWPVDRT